MQRCEKHQPAKSRAKERKILGDYREMAIPVPIPNTEVKHLIADGTIQFAVWESRTLPRYFLLSYQKPDIVRCQAFLVSGGVTFAIPVCCMGE